MGGPKQEILDVHITKELLIAAHRCQNQRPHQQVDCPMNSVSQVQVVGHEIEKGSIRCWCGSPAGEIERGRAAKWFVVVVFPKASQPLLTPLIKLAVCATL
jgi:hypothetical protein